MNRFILCLGLLAVFISCKKDDNGPTPSLTAGPALFNVGPEAGSVVFNIVSNQNWTVSSDQTWATVSTTTGANDGIITVQYSANGLDSRTANITVSNGSLQARIVLNQGFGIKATPSIPLDPMAFNKNSFTISIEAGVAWQLQIQDPTWLSSNVVSGSSGTTILTLSNKLNYGTAPRTNTMIFSDLSNNPLKTLSFNQMNSMQAYLLLDWKWSVVREYKAKVKPNGDSTIRNGPITEPCELDDWIVIGQDSIGFFQGPVPCQNPRGNEKIKANFNAGFTTVSVTNGIESESYQITKLTTDSLIIESIPPFPNNEKAKRWLAKKP